MAIGQRWKATGIGLAQLDGERHRNYWLRFVLMEATSGPRKLAVNFAFPNISVLDSRTKVGSLIRTPSENGTCEGPSEPTIFSKNTHLFSVHLCPRVNRLDKSISGCVGKVCMLTEFAFLKL